MAIKLTEFLPSPEDLDPSAIIETRKRLETYIRSYWPQLDTRPNSVFGDIYLTPMATLMTAAEVAMARFKSDLDLSKVASGTIYDTEFVESYLKNFGIDKTLAVNSSGTIKLVFNRDAEYIIEASTTFSFGSATFFANPEEGNPIYIKPTTETGARRMLVKTGDDQYEVYLPVAGTPGSVVNDGDQALISNTLDGLVSVTAVGGFDPGKPAENLVLMAARAQRQFSAASLTSRSGVVSFVSHRWPNLLAVSATVTGDREMLRSGVSPLGISEGAVDVFVKSQHQYASGETLVTLTYDTERQAWVGRLLLPVIPAFYNFSAGIFQTSDFQNSRGVNKIYSKSVHPTVDNVGIAYSKYEALGIAITDTNPQNFTAAVTSPVTALSSTTSQLVIRGEYNGNLFSQYGNRSIRLRFDSLTEIDGMTAVVANVVDAISGDRAVVYFTGNTDTNPTIGVVLKTDVGYKSMFSGLDLEIQPAGPLFIPADMIGQEFAFAFQGRTASFSVNYLYDPFLVQVDAVLGNPDHKPVNTDPIARSFVICHVKQFVINYRVRYGQRVDTEAAAAEIVSYINGLGYPNQYEDSVISAIMVNHGASGISSIVKKGLIYPSMAAVFVDKAGNENAVPRLDTTTLLPSLNDYGVGARNIGYLIDTDTIVFNGSAY